MTLKNSKRKPLSYKKFALLFVSISLSGMLFVNCSSTTSEVGPLTPTDSTPSPDPAPNPPTPPEPAGTTDYTFSRLSPEGGFVSSIAFRPGHAGEIWASGDDSSGLFRTQNSGSIWESLKTPPKNISTYALTFDPTNSNTIYAPDHFGRGLIKSTDGGLTWQMLSSGLPADNNFDERINDLAIDPNSSQTLFLALSGGLYKSTNGGQSFTHITHSAFSNNTDSHFRSVKIQKIDNSNSQIFVGSEKGRVYKSTNGGTTWTELTGGGYLPVTDLAVTANALYIAFSDGTITKSTTYVTNAFSFVNNAPGGGPIESGMWTKIQAISGASANADQLFIGTTYKAASIKWGFFYSSDGGTTLQKRVNGLNNSSTFSLAVNPTNTSEIVMGTINNGIFKTTDQGSTWSAINSGIQATAILAFVEDPVNSNHLLMSSTAGLDGTSKVFETLDRGGSWGEIAFFSDKSIRSFLMPQNNTSVIVAGTHRRGIYKTTTGVGGTWNQVNNADVIFGSLRKDQINNNILYASSYEPTTATALGTYVSTDGGNTWIRRLIFGVTDVIPHPSSTGVAVAVTGDVFGTTDSFTSTQNSLGLAAHAPGEIFFSAAFLPGTATLLVGSSSAKIYKTTNFNASGSGVTWQTISLPAQNVVIKDIIILDASTWIVNAFNADINVKPTSTPGLLKTTDGGATWTFLDVGLAPSQLTFRIHPSLHNSNRYYLGMWGSGLLSLDF